MTKVFCLTLFLNAVCTTALTQPPGKHWEGVAYNETNSELAVFSGTEYINNKWKVTDSLWLYNGKWRVVDDNSITGRWAHGLSYHDNAIYTYGGLR